MCSLPLENDGINGLVSELTDGLDAGGIFNVSLLVMMGRLSYPLNNATMLQGVALYLVSSRILS
jgi:hypothetical protein